MKKEIISNLDSEKEICETINDLIIAIKDEKLLETVPRGEFISFTFGRYIDNKFIPFQVSCEPIKDYHNNDILYLKKDSDAAFFESACSFPKSKILVADLFNFIIKHNVKVGKYKVPCRDEEQVFGLTQAVALIRSSSTYCRLYASFLKTLDMDHAVYESMVLLYTFKIYGCNLDTMYLLAVYLFPASGQGSDEDLDYLLEKFSIQSFLDDQNNFEAFLNFMLEAFKQVHDHNKAFYSTFYFDCSELDENGKNNNFLKILRKVEASYKTTI